MSERAAWLYVSNGAALIGATASVAWLHAWDSSAGAAAMGMCVDDDVCIIFR